MLAACYQILPFRPGSCDDLEVLAWVQSNVVGYRLWGGFKAYVLSRPCFKGLRNSPGILYRMQNKPKELRAQSPIWLNLGIYFINHVVDPYVVQGKCFHYAIWALWEAYEQTRDGSWGSAATF